MEKQRLFVDMDGTLAVFTPVDELETLYEQGYFLNLKAIDNVVQAVKDIIRNNPDIEVNILSSVLSDSKYALEEKNAWLDRYLPEIDKDHRLFPPCGTDKKDFIKNGVQETDFLLDDYTKNLTLWQPPAKGIKLLNGINHTKGTWKHDCLRYDKPADELANNIVNIIKGKEEIRDEKPILWETEQQNLPYNDLLKMKPLYARYFNADFLKIDGVERYKLLCDFGDCLLAATLSKDNKFEFVTWRYDYDRKGVSLGHYFGSNYEVAMQDFAVRAGLIDRRKLFNKNELTSIYNACIYRGRNDESLCYDTEKELHILLKKIEELVPEAQGQQEQQYEQDEEFER